MTLNESRKKYLNDFELAKFFVKNYLDMEDADPFWAEKIIRSYPNYYELGNIVRNG